MRLPFYAGEMGEPVQRIPDVQNLYHRAEVSYDFERYSGRKSVWLDELRSVLPSADELDTKGELVVSWGLQSPFLRILVFSINLVSEEVPDGMSA